MGTARVSHGTSASLSPQDSAEHTASLGTFFREDEVVTSEPGMAVALREELLIVM